MGLRRVVPLNSLKDRWLQLKHWQSAIWLPVLPPVGALLELVALTALILAVDWMLPNVDLADVEPSPYWLPVLLLSLQYGTVAGLLAAAVATAAYIFNGFPEQAIGENLFSYLLRIWALPMLWVGASLILGQFRLRQIEVKQRLKRDLDQRSLEASSLAGYNKELEARCHRLERELAVTATGHPGEVLKALSHLSASGGLETNFERFCTDVFPGAELSVFAATPFGFSCVATSGWANDAPWLTEFTATHALARSIMAERRAISVLKSGDEAILGNQGLVVQPVASGDGSRVVGFIKLESSGPAHIDADTPARLSVISRLIAAQLAEPRVVVSNTVRDTADAGGSKAAELTKGWRHTSWRVISADEDASSEVEPGSRPSRRN